MTRLLIIGSGVAGLTAALTADAVDGVDVTVLTKASIDRSNTAWAQGGVAVVTHPNDSVESHIADTLVAGAGLSLPRAVEILCTEGPAAIATMIDQGVEFDRVDGELERGLEAAHGFARILHGGGDSTGAVIARGLIAAVRERGVRVLENTMVTDLVVTDGTVTGVQFLDGSVLHADAVILATGGAGQLFPHTTNPSVATGDGVAIALRAGAIAADLEFYQFHPTSLASGDNHLISEAVRGEGGHLINDAGERFMLGVHPEAELAPRDVVARAITDEMRRQGGSPVCLDVRHLGAEFLAQRFPTINAVVVDHGFDWAHQPVPVTPAAHYFMGGVRVDESGRTSLPGLLAVGEVACNGLHGANRLASNSLLEGAVFAHRVATAAIADASGEPTERAADPFPASTWAAPITVNLEDGTEPFIRHDLQHLLWDAVGLSRSELELLEASATLARWSAPGVADVKTAEDANLLALARAMVASALARCESTGAHWRSDAPANVNPETPRHSTVVAAS